ncbi:MAG: DNA repair protein RecO [Psychroflexus sp.]
MQIKTKAIVISTLKFGEADLIAKCFTQDQGLTSYLLRGIRKSKKGKLRTSMFQQLTLLDLEATHRDNKNLQFIKEAKVYFPFKTLHSNIYKSSMLMFLAEVLKSAIQEEEQNQALFIFLEESMMHLDESTQYANFHLLFLVRLSRFLGFYPDASEENARFFNLLEGQFQPIEMNKYCIENQSSETLRTLVTENYNYTEVETLKLNQSKRQAFLEFLMLYFQLHLQGFKKPKSLEILQQLF